MPATTTAANIANDQSRPRPRVNPVLWDLAKTLRRLVSGGGIGGLRA